MQKSFIFSEVLNIINEELIQKIKESNDIVDIISEDVELKKVGNKYVGKCPFHDDGSPSLRVYPDTQSFYCFGCGAGKVENTNGSDVIAYIMNIKNLEWNEAIEYLAEKAEIEIESKPDPNAHIYARNTQFSRDCYMDLYTYRDALEYVYSRGFDDEDINTWRIGYTVNDQFFKNRIIFPVLDGKKKTVGFTSRRYPDDSKILKCLHSPTDNVFRRNAVLYGLAEAMPYIKSSGEVFVVEGPPDVISMHKMGFKNTVGTLGCEISDEQIEMLLSLGVRIIFAYDGDKAGIEASSKACDKLVIKGIGPYITIFPNEYDPNDILLNTEKDEAIELIKNNTFDYCFYKIKQYVNSYDSMLMHTKKEFYKNTEDFIDTIPDGALKNAVQSFINDRIRGGI